MIYQIFSEKVDVANVSSKCGSMENATHKAGGGDKKVTYTVTLSVLLFFPLFVDGVILYLMHLHTCSDEYKNVTFAVSV